MKIYKYSPYNEQAVDNLKKYGLWFNSKFEDDPKDNNLPIGEFKPQESLDDSIEFFNQNPELYNKYSKIFKESQIPRRSDKPFSAEEMMQALKKTYHGITCFTTTGYSQYMWKKFAAKHSGFCMCFDTDLDKDFFRELYTVQYEKNPPKIDLMDNDLAKQMEVYSLTKGEDFIPENEVRLFKHESGLLNYKSRSLIEIKLGKFFNDENIFTNLIRQFYKHDISIVKGT
ncbi:MULTISPECIES: DUF2971 domain-containing protein [Reichenbachiella]|uniref:DUF2971 domain-containing protein n=1 Tax=Reichenbachiella TaxID=156993 RepID=UPI001314241B|nr:MULTISPECIES: DUF2971 domain-containing protein [Reichenbachiella]MBU2914030.1 DUF2971 domain-containing protein [Reichenbachiella agariperforans]